MDAKHILIIEVDDELPDIYDKLKATKEKSVHLFVPRQSILLHSIVNLKILKRKADELKKELTLITKDKRSLKLIESVGFQVAEEKDVADVPEVAQKMQKEKAPRPNVWQMVRKKLEQGGKESNTPYVFSKPSRQPLFTFLGVSLLIFLFILYVALPSATIYIKPTLKVQSSSLNIELVDKNKVGRLLSEDDRIIPLYPIATTYERTVKLTPTGRIFRGTNATGVVTLFNKTKDPWPIVANSRLQTKEGQVFLTKYFVTVPGGSSDTPGKINVEVVARDKDAEDLFMGSRGNIAPTTFFLPALSQYNQNLLSGQSFAPFTGGSDLFDYFVTKADLDIAQQKISSELELSAVAELKKNLDQQALLDSVSRPRLFDRSEKMIGKHADETQVRAKENDQTPTFEAWGKMTATGYYFSEADLETILKNNLIVKHLSPTEKILKTKEDSLQIDEVLDANPDTGRVKINASLEGIVSYDFLSNTSELVKTIKEAVVGKTKEEAETFVNNQKEVSEGIISVWPLWSPTLPTIPENIKIQIEE